MKIFLLFLMIAFGWTFSNAQQRKITPEDIADLQLVAEAKFSPNGASIAYVTRVLGGESDPAGKRWMELSILPAAGGTAKKYIAKPNSAANIEWSPAGDRIFFLSTKAEHNPKPQIYSIPLDGGEAALMSEHAEPVLNFALSPDGNWAAFTATDGKTPEEELADKKAKDWIVYGQNYKYTRLYLLNLKTREIKKVFTENLHITGYSWAPDNQRIVFTACETPETDATLMFNKVYTVDVTKGGPKVLCATAGKLGHAEFSPDGSTVAFAGAVDISDPLAQSLFTVSASGGMAKNCMPGAEASLVTFHWLDAKTIIALNARGVISTLEEYNVSSGKWNTLYDKGAIMNQFQVHPATGMVCAIGNTISHPGELMSGSLKKGELNRLTFHNAVLKDIRMAKQEVVEWTGPDGWKIQGILTWPLDYVQGQKYPLILQIHGGPEGISQNGFNTRALYPVQLLAANNYFVLEPNYRGSQGRGVAFAKGDHNDLGGKEYEDVLAGIKFLGDKGWVDTTKVGSGGFSYGGYFSAWAATRHSNKFKACLVGAGITNWVSFTQTCDIPHENSLVHWNFYWWDNPELVWMRSPLAWINDAKTPTLFVHGEKDLRVPLSQSDELYHALIMKKVPTEMVVYKRQPHGINERAAMIDYMNRTLAWWKKWVN